jgi:ketosteroid isomerase-like protein
MGHGEALDLLDRMHAALGAFYAGGETDHVRELLTEDVEWHVPGDSPIAGDYHGVDAVLAYFAKRRDLASATFRMQPRETLIGETHVGVITDGSATIAGAERRWTTLGLYEIRDNRVAACWLLPLDPVLFDSIWSGSAR